MYLSLPRLQLVEVHIYTQHMTTESILTELSQTGTQCRTSANTLQHIAQTKEKKIITIFKTLLSNVILHKPCLPLMKLSDYVEILHIILPSLISSTCKLITLLSIYFCLYFLYNFVKWKVIVLQLIKKWKLNEV